MRNEMDATDVGIEWIERAAGTSAVQEYGALMPQETLSAIRESHVALKGPITTPVGTGFRSVNVALRKALDLYVNLRPAKHYRGQIDFFAVYCPETCGVYLIPIADVPVDSGASLRVDPPRNSQNKRIRFAADYQIARVTTEGLRASSGA